MSAGAGTPADAASPFDRLRVRGLLLAFAGALIVVLVALALFGPGSSPGGEGARRHSVDARLMLLLVDVLMTLVVVVMARRARLDWRRLFGGWPRRDELPLIAVMVPVALLTLGAFTVVYVPLSYLAPGFVQRAILTPPSVFEVRTVGDWLVFALLAVVVAPLFEETLFRGILLQRWARRWGTRAGVILSSLVFAVQHTEWVGHFLFGVAMAALYLRTRRLWVPILAHAANNFAISLPVLWTVLMHRTEPVQTLAELRRDWGPAIASLLAGGALLIAYLRRYWPGDQLRAALAGPVPYEVAGAVAAADAGGYAASPISSPDSTSAS